MISKVLCSVSVHEPLLSLLGPAAVVEVYYQNLSTITFTEELR
jgi:hypothetical protein